MVPLANLDVLFAGFLRNIFSINRLTPLLIDTPKIHRRYPEFILFAKSIPYFLQKEIVWSILHYCKSKAFNNTALSFSNTYGNSRY